MQTWASLFSPTHMCPPSPSLLPGDWFWYAVFQPSSLRFSFLPLNGKGLQMWPTGVQLHLCVIAKWQQPLEKDILERVSTFWAELTAGVGLDFGDANDQLLMERGQPPHWSMEHFSYHSEAWKVQFAHLLLRALLMAVTYAAENLWRRWGLAKSRMKKRQDSDGVGGLLRPSWTSRGWILLASVFPLGFL